MPTLHVDFHPEAVAEAGAAFAWYRERSDEAAAAFLAEIDRAIEMIAEAPDRWPRYAHKTRRFLLHRFPFSVVYRRTAESLQVVAFAHGKRRPGYWKGR